MMLRALVNYKWTILVQVLCLLAHRVTVDMINKEYENDYPEWAVLSLCCLGLTYLNHRETGIYHLPVTIIVLLIESVLYKLMKGKLALILSI